MADQIFNVNSGFFDAVNSDRTYSAEDMNKPYSRVVADGVFATQTGTPSDDLQVVSANNGMKISVLQGQAILASKWFENPAAIVITVPNNTAVSARIDSVLMQINKTLRVGTIVYRTGSSNAAPAINTDSSIIEMRLANIRVPSNARQITNANITDLRGSSDCPWVTGLITQVDTSTLFNQYRAAYNEFYNEMTEEYEVYVDRQRESWEAFIAQLTSELTVTPSVFSYESTYTATEAVTTVPINIATFDEATDDLQVFINGIYAPKNVRWTLNGSSITLNSAIAAGDVVNFLVYKSFVTGNVEAVSALLAEINDRIAVLNYQYGTPLVAATKAAMTNTSKIYVYTGSETGMVTGDWYYWTGSAWAAGGVYNSAAVTTDPSLSIADVAADAKATGDAIAAVDDKVDVLDGVIKEGLCVDTAFNPTVTRGEYIAFADGTNKSSNKYARTNVFDAIGTLNALELTDDTYQYAVSFYNETGALDGTGFLGHSEYSDAFSYIPFTAKKIGITFRRLDQTNLTTSDVTAIKAALKVYRVADTTLALSNIAADAKAVGDRFGADLDRSLHRLTSTEITNLTSFADMPKGCYFSATKAKVESLNGGTFPFTLSNITYMVVSYRYAGSSTKAGIIEIFSGSKSLHFIGYILASGTSVTWYDRNAAVKTAESNIANLQAAQELKILFYGSSFEYSTIGLMPEIMKEIAPFVKLTVGLCYYSGATVADHITRWDGTTKYTVYSEYTSETGAWTNSSSAYTGKEAFDLHEWDYISIHEGANVANYADVESFLDTITEYSDHAINFIYTMVQANGKNGTYNSSYTQATGKEKSDEMFRRIAELAQTLIEDYPQISYALPCAAAVQNARTTALSELGTYGDLCDDQASHLQNGLPTLIPAYAAAYKLCEIIGVRPKMFSVPLDPTDQWLTTYNLYTHSTHGSCVGVTLANKILAQKCALMAIKYPYSITDMS